MLQAVEKSDDQITKTDTMKMIFRKLKPGVFSNIGMEVVITWMMKIKKERKR